MNLLKFDIRIVFVLTCLISPSLLIQSCDYFNTNEYEDGVAEVVRKYYKKSGELKEIIPVDENNKKHGTCKKYYPDGKLNKM